MVGVQLLLYQVVVPGINLRIQGYSQMKKCNLFFIVAAALALSALPVAKPAYAVCTGQFPAGWVCGNSGGSQAVPSPKTLTSILDRAISSTQGSMLFRNATVWTGLAPGTAGLPLLSGGAGANLAYGILGLSAGGLGGSQAGATANQARGCR